MPNWAEGNIRLRGKKENILNFLKNELVGVIEKINTEWDQIDMGDDVYGRLVNYETRPVILEDNRGGTSLIIKRDPDTGDAFYFKNSTRQFIFTEDKEIEVLFSEGKNRNKDTIVFIDDFNGGWDVDDEYFKDIAKKYKIDIRIFVWEAGMCWSALQTFYRNGQHEMASRTYSDWLWDSPMPHYGG